jgi:hypothetical protein
MEVQFRVQKDVKVFNAICEQKTRIMQNIVRSRNIIKLTLKKQDLR